MKAAVFHAANDVRSLQVGLRTTPAPNLRSPVTLHGSSVAS